MKHLFILKSVSCAVTGLTQKTSPFSSEFAGELTIALKALSASQVLSCKYQNRCGRAFDDLVIALTASASFHGSESARAAASTSHNCLVC